MWQPKERQVPRQGHTTNKINWISINTLSRWSGGEHLITKIYCEVALNVRNFLFGCLSYARTQKILILIVLANLWGRLVEYANELETNSGFSALGD